MKVTLRLFAQARELAGQEEVEVTLAPSANIDALRRALAEQVPALARLAPHLLFAHQERYLGSQAEIPPGATIACFPPVSGG